MNYRNAYSMLNRAGLIDDIIGSESENGFCVNIIKLYIIHGIEYYCEFTKSSMFADMKYWQDTRFIKTEEEWLEHRITNRVCKELALIEMQQSSAKIAALQYMIDKQV